VVAEDRPDFASFIIEHQGYSHDARYVTYVGAIANVNLGNYTLTTAGLILTAGQDIRPSADSTTAINIAQADGTDFVTFDTTNKRVGIGTTAPATTLDVNGTITGENITANGDLTIGNSTTEKIDWASGNITYVPIGGDIATYITNATAGDTLILATGTYTITAALTVDKALNIIGQGVGQTTISRATNSGNIFTITSDNVRIAHMSLVHTGAGTNNYGINISGTAGTVFSNVMVNNLNIRLSGAATSNYGILYSDAGGVVRDCVVNVSSSTNAYGIYKPNSASAETSTTLTVYNSDFTVSGVTNALAVYVRDNSATEDSIIYIYNSKLQASGATTSTGLVTEGGDALAYAYYCILNGTTYDVRQISSSVLQLSNCTLINNLTTGTITYDGEIRSEDLWLSDDLTLLSDTGVISLGAASDATIQFDGDSLNIVANAVTATDDLILTARYVGIGTTSPSDILEVTTSTATGKSFTLKGATYAVMEMLNTDANANARNWAILAPYTAYGAFEIRNSNALGGDPLLAGTTRFMIDKDGKVGIGTTSPGYILDIAASLPNLRFAPSSTYAQILSLATSTSTADFYITNSNTGKLYLRTSSVYGNPSIALTIDNTGNVGIGTTAPSNKLDVVGSYLRLGSDSTNEALRTNATQKYALLVGQHYTNAEEPIGYMFSNSDGTNNIVYFGGGLNTVNSATSLRFLTGANNTTLTGTERMRIDSAGLVGIGTTTPSYALDVNGTINTQTGVVRAFGQILFSYAGVGNPVLIGTAQATDTLQLRGGGSTRLTIDTTGNVGIGTTSPTSKLEVSLGGNSLGIDANPGAFGAATAQILLSGGGAVAPWDQIGSILYRARTSDTAGRSSHIFYTGASSTERMRITESGNVGIGTTTPLRRLDINEDTGNCLRLIYNDADGSAANYVDFLVGSTGGLTITSSLNSFTFGNGVADTDTVLNFTGTTNSGVLTWMEDEDQFKFSDRIQTDGGIIGKITTVTDTYIILVSDETIICNKTTDFTVTLPTGVIGQRFNIKNINTGLVTVSLAGDMIDGETSQTLNQWDCMQVQCYAANKWGVI
jgi:hypothetical protein